MYNKISIVGGSGSGKSTLVNLIPRFYDITSGNLLIDGVDIKNIANKDLRKIVGFVPQKGILFSGTIESNIKYGNPEMADEQMIEAAEIAQATEFIESKPEKYKEPIAQGGSNVSGGQKQRVAIARAIAKNPKLLLCDEPTGALDYKTGKEVLKLLQDMARKNNMTVIIITHNQAITPMADRIIKMKSGQIEQNEINKKVISIEEVEW